MFLTYKTGKINYLNVKFSLFFSNEIYTTPPVELPFLTMRMNYNTILIFELRHEKTNVCICENKDADQLQGNRETDQHLYLRYIDSTIPLLSKAEISSL